MRSTSSAQQLRTQCLVAGWLALALHPGPSWGQETRDDPVEEQGGPAQPELGEIVPRPPSGIEAIEVTGERLDATNVQDEAQAITAFDTGELDRLQIGNVDRLSLNVPGLHVGQQGQNAIITLRGVGTENASLTGEPGVAFHIDGIYYGSPAAARAAFFDIEAIEVKRGPQGFLGGKNSTSGAIEIKTRDPATEYEVSGDMLWGNYDRQRGRGALNVPLGEFFAARVAVFYEERDGYLDRQTVTYDQGPGGRPDLSNPHFRDVSDSRDPFDLDNFGLRGKLRFMPTESVDLVVGYNYFKETGDGPQADIVPLDRQACPPGNPSVPPGSSTRMGILGGCATPRPNPNDFTSPGIFYPVTEEVDPRKTLTDFGSAQNDRYWGFSGTLRWEAPQLPIFGETQLKLLGGFQRSELDFRWDFDGSDQEYFNIFLDNIRDEHTAELQWSGGERLGWQASLFFQRQTGEQRVLSPGSEQFPNPNVTKVPTFQSAAAYDASTNYDSEQWIENKSYGAVLHGTYALTDSLSFSLGGRWNKDHKRSFLGVWNQTLGNFFEACEPKGSGTDYLLADSSPPKLVPSAFSEPLPHSCGLSFRGTMWGSRLEWKPADDYLLYAGIDRGYKSGGFASGGIGSYKPERIWAYSLGAKSEFFDQRLQLNLEGFVYNYTDMQIALLDGSKIRTENTDAQMYGWELEVRTSPIQGLSLQGLISYLHTETKDYFSLDPASLGDTLGLNRLAFREAAERTGTKFPGETFCITRAPRKKCKDIGTSGNGDGLDDFSGNQLSRSPELKWNISAEYEIPLSRFGSLIPGIQYAWQDEAFYRVFNRDFDKQDAFHETNLSLTWKSPEQKWEVRGFVNNLEDEAVKQNILVGPRNFGSIPLAWYNEARFYGVQVGFRY